VGTRDISIFPDNAKEVIEIQQHKVRSSMMEFANDFKKLAAFFSIEVRS
jgi:7-cyano-7-deazaguanine synthase in queuosine biosynthesis